MRSKTPSTGVYLPERKSQGRRTKGRSNKVPVEERTQQPQAERHGYRKDKGACHLYRRRKMTKSSKWTLLLLQPKRTHCQVLPEPRSKGSRSIHVQHPSRYCPNPRTSERNSKGTSTYSHPPRGI